MKILKLELENIRNFSRLDMDFGDLTIIYGSNAQGKTNLLEAIYYLTLTKSSRKGRENDIIQKGRKEGRIKGIFQTENQGDLEIEFILGPQKIGKINGAKTKLKDILGQAETVFFTVDDLEIIESPQKRRRFLNVFISLLDKKYFLNLLEYQQSLKRRNKTLSLLKYQKSSRGEINFWDEKLASLGTEIIKKRKETILRINNLLKSSPLFFTKNPLCLKYNPKNITKETLLKELQDNLEKDIILEQTTIGPHRDIIKFEADSLDLEIFGSRGEKRTAVIELKMAEIELTQQEKNIIPILLLDDIFSELDNKNKANALQLIQKQQTIITAINPEQIRTKLKNAKVYKLENGEIR